MYDEKNQRKRRHRESPKNRPEASRLYRSTGYHNGTR
nr:MAG TPA: hypothetical protein [Caudoviricetes sp.]